MILQMFAFVLLIIQLVDFVVPGDPYPLKTDISPAPTPAPSYTLSNFSGGYQYL